MTGEPTPQQDIRSLVIQASDDELIEDHHVAEKLSGSCLPVPISDWTRMNGYHVQPEPIKLSTLDLHVDGLLTEGHQNEREKGTVGVGA